MNTVAIIGNLTKDPEIRYTPGGMAVLNFSLAVNEIRKGEKIAHFFNVTVWDKTAENCNQYLSKGSKVGVEGFLQQQRWEKDGQPQSKVIISARRVEFLTPKPQTKESEAI